MLATPGSPAVKQHMKRRTQRSIDVIMDRLIGELRGVWTVVDANGRSSIRVDNGREWRDVNVLWIERDYVVEED